MFQGALTLLVRAVRLDTRMLFPHLFRFMFVGIIYYPAMLLEGSEWGSETYGRYLGWWLDRSAAKSRALGQKR